MTLVVERASEGEMSKARRAMVDSQLRVSGVNDPDILAAFSSVKREEFVPADRRAVAYADRAVPLGDGTVLAPALTHGQMLTAAEIDKNDTVLVIGAPGTYLAALAAELATSVTVAAPDGDWTVGAPFSLVLIDGAVEQVPTRLAATLAAGGRVVTGLVERGVPRLAVGRAIAGELSLTSLGEADFAVLGAFAQPKTWSF
ncbi:MAG: protein-L-isoaspartate O-methyltransferase [Novosphingobium sp. 12-64-8]|nr:MAG: protein-L-isoaspartate O-methyltransferase [Novosphingobium sp. 12-64-8]